MPRARCDLILNQNMDLIIHFLTQRWSSLVHGPSQGHGDPPPTAPQAVKGATVDSTQRVTHAKLASLKVPFNALSRARCPPAHCFYRSSIPEWGLPAPVLVFETPTGHVTTPMTKRRYRPNVPQDRTDTGYLSLSSRPSRPQIDQSSALAVVSNPAGTLRPMKSAMIERSWGFEVV